MLGRVRSRISDHYALGAALLERNDLAGAEVAMKKALAAAPEHPSALLQMGRIALARRNPWAAAPYLERVVDQAPGEPVGWVMLAQALAACGEAAAGVDRAGARAGAVAPVRGNSRDPARAGAPGR